MIKTFQDSLAEPDFKAWCNKVAEAPGRTLTLFIQLSVVLILTMSVVCNHPVWPPFIATDDNHSWKLLYIYKIASGTFFGGALM